MLGFNSSRKVCRWTAMRSSINKILLVMRSEVNRRTARLPPRAPEMATSLGRISMLSVCRPVARRAESWNLRSHFLLRPMYEVDGPAVFRVRFCCVCEKVMSSRYYLFGVLWQKPSKLRLQSFDSGCMNCLECCPRAIIDAMKSISNFSS